MFGSLSTLCLRQKSTAEIIALHKHTKQSPMFLRALRTLQEAEHERLNSFMSG